MWRIPPRPGAWSIILMAVGLASLLIDTAAAEDLLAPGFRPRPPAVRALVGGTVVVKPGQTLLGATIVIRDGLIEAVSTNMTPPDDAWVIDAKGEVIYAGFIEPYLVMEAGNGPVSTTNVEAIDRRSLTAEGLKFYGAPGTNRAGAGYPLTRVSPETQAVRSFAPNEKTAGPLREIGFTAAVMVPARGIFRGTSALALLKDNDANGAVLKADVFQYIAFDTASREEGYPSSLMGVIATVRQTFFDAQHDALDHADYARHPNRKSPEYNPALEALAPAMNKQTRVVFEPGSALMDDRAAQVARELGLDFVIAGCGQEWRRPDLIKATGATYILPLNFPTLPKLPSAEDWDQISLEQLRAWDWAAENPALVRRQGLSIALTTHGLSDKKDFRKNLLLALDRGLSEEDALAALTTTPALLCGVEKQMGTIEAGKLANLTVVQGKSYFDPDAKVRAVWIDGQQFSMPPESAKPEKDEAKAEEAKPAEAKADTKGNPEKDKKKNELRGAQKTLVARSPLEGRGPITNPPSVLVRHATIWTCGPQGILSNASALFTEGKVAAVGPNVEAPANALIIDADGMSLTPGVIDCHSHTAILGGVNEMALPSTAMVRIYDVVNSETETLRQQLAGGVTAANLLHGSANPIGGQNCVIKLRDGASPEDLVFQNAPPGIKFALGENVKQSNWGERSVTRFPQTRMGVRTFYENRFTAARAYLADWDKYRSNGGVPPQRDLELEALGEVLQGKRWIHCHSYRQDEILMLTRLTQAFGVQIGSFQHGLECYKLADELAAAGIGVSCFSDWWAYKFEVYDAIPYNGSLLAAHGVPVSFNSDSSELARRLYLEAAKAVKYGGTAEIEAFKFVTLNAAKQLRIDAYTGSLEPGKDADFALWSKGPLDSGTVCQQTWIDGKKYFDRLAEAENNAKLKKEREDLIAKARKVAKLAGGGGGEASDDGKGFFDVALEHQYDGVARHCLDEAEEGP